MAESNGVNRISEWGVRDWTAVVAILLTLSQGVYMMGVLRERLDNHVSDIERHEGPEAKRERIRSELLLYDTTRQVHDTVVKEDIAEIKRLLSGIDERLRDGGL